MRTKPATRQSDLELGLGFHRHQTRAGITWPGVREAIAREFDAPRQTHLLVSSSSSALASFRSAVSKPSVNQP
jgi:hypothetical protein